MYYILKKISMFDYMGLIVCLDYEDVDIRMNVTSMKFSSWFNIFSDPKDKKPRLNNIPFNLRKAGLDADFNTAYYKDLVMENPDIAGKKTKIVIFYVLFHLIFD